MSKIEDGVLIEAVHEVTSKVVPRGVSEVLTRGSCLGSCQGLCMRSCQKLCLELCLEVNSPDNSNKPSVFIPYSFSKIQHFVESVQKHCIAEIVFTLRMGLKVQTHKTLQTRIRSVHTEHISCNTRLLS